MRAISRENWKHYLSNVLKQPDLLSTVWREVEHQDGQKADAHAGDDEVDGVEESLPPHGDVEGDVQVGLVTAGVELDISKSKQESLRVFSQQTLPLCRNSQDIPLHGFVEFFQVYSDLHNIINMLILPGFLIPGLLILFTANISVLVTEINLEGKIMND